MKVALDQGGNLMSLLSFEATLSCANKVMCCFSTHFSTGDINAGQRGGSGQAVIGLAGSNGSVYRGTALTSHTATLLITFIILMRTCLVSQIRVIKATRNPREMHSTHTHTHSHKLPVLCMEYDP